MVLLLYIDSRVDHISGLVGNADSQINQGGQLNILFGVVIRFDYGFRPVLVNGIELVMCFVHVLLGCLHSVIGSRDDFFFLVLRLRIRQRMLRVGELLLGGFKVAIRL